MHLHRIFVLSHHMVSMLIIGDSSVDDLRQSKDVVMSARTFQQVDVFSGNAFSGNPVAVVFDADGLSTAQMAQFANWTNLTETTFVLAATDPRADYQVRIFTPSQELPFAGHPTLGTCHAWLQAGGNPKADRIIQQCAAGLIEIKTEDDILSFAAPHRRRSGPLDPATLDQITRGLGLSGDDVIAHQWCDNGPPWQSVLLTSDALVLAAKPDPAIIADVDFLGLIGPCRHGLFAFEVRGFFPGATRFNEDPVTGSLNAALAQWLIAGDLAPKSYKAHQGTALGRDGHIHLQMDEQGQVWVGGQSITCITGRVNI